MKGLMAVKHLRAQVHLTYCHFVDQPLEQDYALD